MTAVIEVHGLHKEYGDTVAVDDVSFSVSEGEIFGILGPNGAGKTTTVECVEGLRKPDRGELRVLGLDPLRDHAELTQLLGAQLQESQLPAKLRVAEALDLYSSFYRAPADWRSLMEALGLVPAQVTITGTARPLPPETESALLRTAQEALANVARHAAATRVGVTLSYMDDEVVLDVRDDGRGFQPQPQPQPRASGGFGLVAMRQRIEAARGTLDVESEPGQGTAISARVPAGPRLADTGPGEAPAGLARAGA